MEVKVGLPEGLNLQTKKLAEYFKTEKAEKNYIARCDLILVVDTGHSSLLKEWLDEILKAKGYKIFIDHHPISESILKVANKLILDEEASSTSEIVFQIFEVKNIKPSRKVSEALMVGILEDSQFLAISSPLAIKSMAKLCDYSSLDKVRELLRFDRDYSEVVARLKGAQRMKIYKIGNWVFAYTEVGSYQASVARALINLGANISLALGEANGELRGSFRATPSFCSDAKIHLGRDLAERLAKEFDNGIGGGHKMASSFTVKANLKEVKKVVLNILKERLGQEVKVIS